MLGSEQCKSVRKRKWIVRIFRNIYRLSKELPIGGEDDLQEERGSKT